jgi:hypothetical protein
MPVRRSLPPTGNGVEFLSERTVVMSQKFLAFVLLRQKLAEKPDAISREINREFAGAGVNAQVVSASASGSGAYILSLSGTSLMIAIADFPVPPETFETSLKLNTTWPNARAHVGQHRAHAIVSTLGNLTSHESKLKAAIAASRVCSVLVGMTNGIGIYWEAADYLIEASAYRKASQSMGLNPEDVPLDVWAQFIWHQNKDSKTADPAIGLATKGLNAFFGRELEYLPKPLPQSIIASRMIGMARWLLAKGLIFKDGDSCGSTADEIIRVVYKDRGDVCRGPVVQFDIEHLEQST